LGGPRAGAAAGGANTAGNSAGGCVAAGLTVLAVRVDILSKFNPLFSSLYNFRKN
jgi:hypothetical protein